ncbi:aspartate ammonia-lyase [bacterium]|nr:aspartate ammonia-lyase [bacterium]
MKTRIEKDSLGELEVPEEAYYGVQTARAVENFRISPLRFQTEFVRSLAWIKAAAAKTNRELGLLDEQRANAIEQVALTIAQGAHHDQFVVDVFQAGAGTSFHMNINEVIANRACEILGSKKGDHKLVHPNDHVNMGQSTNDVIPTAIRLTALSLSFPLLEALEKLEDSFESKSKEFDSVIKAGRTHLQDAVPLRLGQEFGGYAACIHRAEEQVSRVSTALQELGIGGSAVGTGLNTHPDYRKRIVSNLATITGFSLRTTDNYFEAMQSMAPFTAMSAVLRNLAIECIRIANDLRLMASGPNTGLNEIQLPAVQPGSSIMPGKVNPVMAEMLNMVCFQVIGADSCITLASQAGQLELNVMMPVIGYNLFLSFSILTNALNAFREKCVDGIEANVEVSNKYAENTLALATVLNPYIGYLKGAEVVKESLKTGRTIKGIVLEKGLLTEQQWNEIFDLRRLTEPNLTDKKT